MMTPFAVTLFAWAAADVAPPPSPPPPPPPQSIAVLELTPASAADASLAKLFSNALVEAVATAAKDARVIGTSELSAVIDAHAQQQLLGCDDERCAADFSKEVAVDRLVVGRVGRVAGADGVQNLIFLSLIDAKSHSVLARTSHAFAAKANARNAAKDAAGALLRSQEYVAGLAPAAVALFMPEAAAKGDRPLAELRLAVLLDEVDETNAPLRTHPVETCVQKQLLDAGASLVSPAVVKSLKGKAAPRQILDGQIPDELGTDEVDVLLAGVVTYAPFADAAAAKLPGLSFTRAEMGAQLLRVDTGAVLASEQPTGLGRGYSVDAARKLAAENVCGGVRTLLEEALRKRASLGERVVLDVDSVDAPQAQDLAQALEKVRRVGKVRLKKSEGRKATFDVVLTAGDGVALALELAKIGVVVDSATAGKVTAKKAL